MSGRRQLEDAEIPAIRPDDDQRSMAVFERDTRSASAARGWLRRFLAARHVPDGVQEDAALVLSELVTNALRHGLGQVVVRAAVADGGRVDLAVTDSGPEQPELLPANPSRVGGVGLHVVAKVSRDWGVARFPGGKTVWAVIAAPTH